MALTVTPEGLREISDMEPMVRVDGKGIILPTYTSPSGEYLPVNQIEKVVPTSRGTDIWFKNGGAIGTSVPAADVQRAVREALGED